MVILRAYGEPRIVCHAHFLSQQFLVREELSVKSSQAVLGGECAPRRAVVKARKRPRASEEQAEVIAGGEDGVGAVAVATIHPATSRQLLRYRRPPHPTQQPSDGQRRDGDIGLKASFDLSEDKWPGSARNGHSQRPSGRSAYRSESSRSDSAPQTDDSDPFETFGFLRSVLSG